MQDPVVARLRDCIDDFKEIMPCVEELINPALKLRHWDEIFDLIGADIPDNDDGTGMVLLNSLETAAINHFHISRMPL